MMVRWPDADGEAPLYMNEQQKHLLQIADDVLQWNLEMLAFFHRVSEVEAMAEISEDDKQELRETAGKIGKLFSEVANLSASQPTPHELIEQLIASHDRLREELASANEKLDGILATRTL